MFKVNNKDAKTTPMVKHTQKIVGKFHWCRPGVFIVNFEHISHLVLVFLLSTLSK